MALSGPDTNNLADAPGYPGSSNNWRDAHGDSPPDSHISLDGSRDTAASADGTEKDNNEIPAKEPLAVSSRDRRPWTPTTATSSDVATDEMEDARSYFDGDSDTGLNHKIDEGTSRMDCIFRLLDLVDERGSGGLVEKIIIDQADLYRLLNTILPGSYNSVTKINFKALDQLNIKPKGLYGVKSEIAQFLHRVGCIDEQFLDPPDGLDAVSELRPGLYLALPPEPDATVSATYETYIFFWPEDESWVDNAPSAVHRNRVTFMRYLTKLCDQVVALVSPAQAESFVWDAQLQNTAAPAGLAGGRGNRSRVFSFEVLSSLEQEENVVASPGFTVNPKLKLPTNNPPPNMELAFAELNSGLVVSTYEGEDFTSKLQEQSLSEMNLRKTIETNRPTLSLGNLDAEAIMILGDLGLRKRYPKAFAGHDKWTRDQEEANRRLRRQIEQEIEADARNIHREAEYIIFNLLHHAYPRYPELNNISDPRVHNLAAAIEDTMFQDLKWKWQLIYGALTAKPGQSDKDIDEFINSVLNPGNHPTQKPGSKKRVISWGPSLSMPDFVKGVNLHFVPDFVKGMFHATTAGFTSLFHGDSHTSLSDQEFVQHLRTSSDGSPVLSKLADHITQRLRVYLRDLGKDVLHKHVPSVLAVAKERESQARLHKRNHALQSERERVNFELLKSLRSVMVLDELNHIQIDALSRNPNAWPGGAQYYQMTSRRNMRHAPQTRFDVYPLVLTEADVQQCRMDKGHLPKPRITPQHKFSFTLETGRSLEFLEILEDKCLIIAKERGGSRLYIDDNHRIGTAINNTDGKLTLRDDRLQGKCVYAFDQRTRLLAVFYGGHEEPKISIYHVDEGFKEVKARGPALSLKQCPGSVKPNGRVVDAFTSPDGSCLLLTVVDESAPTREERLLAFHWASFGSNQNGIEVATLPPSRSNRVITSFEDRSRVYVLSLLGNGTISSLGLQIKHKSMEFSLQSDRDLLRAANVDTLSNCLVDCHLEVWTRFPVLPAIARTVLSPADRQAHSITFVSAVEMPRVEAYFARMISFLGSTACKPVGDVLSSISVGSSSLAPEVIVPGLLASSFPVGSFVTELLCLIPIHLAVTRENQFVPLKDGVWNPEHEQSLLGAEVTTIIDSLSIGWYESIFQSYHATKPVRVVSSMGEQSVGKSYCLNHLADTSFAGSAMRTTEGIWLSCTPTDEYLLVTLDFEAVHTLERSPQEDALLVLFNTAISNLVLFRNNFALSRDISGLFASFQSSTMLLDPDENRDLFNSTLVIIIKDVTDSDTNDIVKEFQLKFRQIITEERDQNFISKLHRGRIQIIPWPVINSHGFYSIFYDLSHCLNNQPITHPSGGIFLHRLKTLMAKIKASDWGSLDQNLAAHRAQQLRGRLPLALRFGRAEQGLEAMGPLKNLDTDEDLSSNDSGIEFFVPSLTIEGAKESEPAIEQTLTALIRLYQPTTSARQSTRDTQYIAEIQQRLLGQLDERLKYVQAWVHTNVSRFPAENQDIRDVLGTLDMFAPLAIFAACDHIGIPATTVVELITDASSLVMWRRTTVMRLFHVDYVRVTIQRTCATSGFTFAGTHVA
ncbi:Vacuolar protein sorting-associated protein 13A [Ceratobasidium sp. 370]|nr:Vacuolar protein sorting-associated protein 13A [Ceratobasidium sp. 370]